MVESPVIINEKVIDRKLNVALTRAKHHLIIIGVPGVFKESETFSNLLKYCFIQEDLTLNELK